jgi:hypothetical protein
MALNALGGDPCSKLNSATYPDLWLPTGGGATANAQNFSRIASAGITKTFSQVLGTISDKTNPLLNTLEATSTYRLLQYMSGGGVSPVAPTLDSFLLKTTSGAIQTIIDTFIVGSTPGIGKGASYTYGGVLTDANIDTVRDSIISSGYLLTPQEIVIDSQLTITDTASVATNNASLVFLSKLEQTGRLSAAQRARKSALETKNLRFYAAFLAEYCFYRTRYQWLLTQYFNIYNTSTNTYISPSQSIPQGPVLLFSGQGSGTNVALNQWSGNFLSQADYLKGIAYHMAVINTRMTDLRRLLNSINVYYSQVFNQVQSTINSNSSIGSNADLQQTITALQSSSKEAKKYLDEAQFSEGVMKYTQEKNRYSNILLSLYAVLNVAALAMIYKLK